MCIRDSPNTSQIPILEIIRRNIEECISLTQLEKKLSSKKQLLIKYGVDVTAPFLHLGHAVNLWMMRTFQEYGHKVIFLIGDFTTKIGDPTGRDTQRKLLSDEEMKLNAQEFIRQVSLVLLTDPEVFSIRRNSEWYDKMALSEFIELTSMVTHAKLIQRDMFQKRIENHREIFMHEMLYPLLQGYDSVMLKSDLTIVGSDQLFNELMGRFYQERFGQEPQIVITSRITPGIDGREKQSKSIGNYIALIDSPREKFGKIMSIPDALIIPYLEVYTDVPEEQIQKCRDALSQNFNPMDIKKFTANKVVARYHGEALAHEEQSWFENTFSKQKIPEDALFFLSVRSGQSLFDTLHEKLPEYSKTALRQLVVGGGIRINGNKVDLTTIITYTPHAGDIIKVGKRKWFQIK